MTAEYGIWSDDGGGFVETQMWSEEEAQRTLAADYSDDDTARVYRICPDHEDQPADGCEECSAEEGDADDDEDEED